VSKGVPFKRQAYSTKGRLILPFTTKSLPSLIFHKLASSSIANLNDELSNTMLLDESMGVASTGFNTRGVTHKKVIQ
jgi:hypothetical protein